MIGDASPLRIPRQWDFVFIGGVPSPGKAKVSRAGQPWKWDEKDGPGTQGANLTYRGARLSHFTITLTFWLDEHFDEWDRWQTLLAYDSTKKNVTAVDVYHPALADRGIKSIIIENIGQIEDGPQPQTWTVEIAVSQYAPPRASPTTTPSSSSANNTHFTESGAGSPATNAQDAQQQEIAKLLAIAQQPD